MVPVERTEVTQKWIRDVVPIIVGDFLAQLFKERLICIKPWSIVATDRGSRSQKISKVKMMIIQVLHRPEARWKTIGGIELWVVLDELRRVHVRPLPDQLLEGLQNVVAHLCCNLLLGLAQTSAQVVSRSVVAC